MSDADYALANYMHEYLLRNGYELNIVRQYCEGRQMRMPKNYFLVETKQHEQIMHSEIEDLLDQSINMDESQFEDPLRNINTEFLKQRTQFKGALELNAMYLFDKHVLESEHYKAFYPAVKQVKAIFGSKTVQDRMNEKFGDNANQVFDTWSGDIAKTNPMKPQNPDQAFWRGVRVKAVMAHLGFNVLSALRQLPSAVMGAQHIGLIPYLHGLTYVATHPKECDTFIKNNMPQIANRSWEREIAEAKSIAKLERLRDKKSKIMPREAMMIMATTADKYAVRTVAMGAYIDHIKKGYTHEESCTYAEEAIERTQPVFSVKDVAETYRGSEIWRMLTTYTNQLNQNFMYAQHDVWGQWRAGQISTAKMIERFHMGLIVPAMIIGAMSRMSPADDAEELMKDIGNQALMSIPIFGRPLSGMMSGYFNVGTPVTLSMIDQTGRMWQAVASKDWEKIGFEGIGLAAYATGKPLIAPKRAVKYGLKYFRDEAENKSLDMW
jgi:hypothetical protein